MSSECDWPILPPEARHGLLGEMLDAIGPETEADPAGVLLGWLTCFGSVVGRGAWVTIGGRQHHPSLFTGIVATTGSGKGDAWTVAHWVFRETEPEWAAHCVCNGVGSGEGLIERVADEQMVLGRDGTAQVIPGATDKRCLLRLSELSRCFKLGRRENATLSEYLRESWDGLPIHLPNRRGNAISTSGYAISVFGDIQPQTLRKLLSGGTEGFDGFANRFLWCVNRSDNDLDDGGSMEPLRPYLDPLREALNFGKQAGEVTWDDDARRLRRENYPRLKRSGDSIPHTDRMRAYVWRLAMLYALLDKAGVIRAEHYLAALAVVDYCRASAALLFGGPEQQGPKPPDPLWLVLLNAIQRQPGINRTGLREVAGHKVAAAEIDAALACLTAQGLAYCREVKPVGKGSPAECWWPVGEGESNQDDTAPAAPPDADRAGAGADAGSVGREESKSPDPEPEAGSKIGEGGNCPLTDAIFLPPSPEPEQQAEQQAGGEAGGVISTASAPAYTHEPSGGFGLATGPATPDPCEPFRVLYHDSPEVRRAGYDADRPPSGQGTSLLERRPGESDEDFFMRRLEAVDATYGGP